LDGLGTSAFCNFAWARSIRSSEYTAKYAKAVDYEYERGGRDLHVCRAFGRLAASRRSRTENLAVAKGQNPIAAAFGQGGI
jgi:hypothetical protein